MGHEESEELRTLIASAKQGAPGAAETLFSLIYQDLKALAGSMMRHERASHTLQTTALVHEAFVKVTAGLPELAAQDRRHLFGIFANAMRQILIDSARRKKSVRHGGASKRVVVESLDEIASAEVEEFVAIGELLDRFQSVDPQAAEVVRLKVFAGLQMSTIAEVLETSKRSVERDWQFARLWLLRESGGYSAAEAAE